MFHFENFVWPLASEKKYKVQGEYVDDDLLATPLSANTVILNNPPLAHPTGLFGYVRGAFPAVAGRIHIAFGYLFDEKLSTWTVIHEATHKFAGTVDNAYWDDVHNRWDKTITVGKAIKNADSYAKFAMEYKDAFLWKGLDTVVA